MIEHQTAEGERRAREIARGAREADRLLSDARETSEAPSSFAQFVAGKAKEKAPKFYAWCEAQWQKIRKQREASKERSRRIMDMVAE